MSTQRLINTKFWSDTFVQTLSSNERYLFLYFLTNEHTNIAGLYEISMGTIVFETNTKEEEIIRILKKLNPRVVYFQEYVLIKNFHKHQNKSPKIVAGIVNTLFELPTPVLAKLAETGYPLAQFDKDRELKMKLERYAFELKQKPPSDESDFESIAKAINS